MDKRAILSLQKAKGVEASLTVSQPSGEAAAAAVASSRHKEDTQQEERLIMNNFELSRSERELNKPTNWGEMQFKKTQLLELTKGGTGEL